MKYIIKLEALDDDGVIFNSHEETSSNILEIEATVAHFARQTQKLYKRETDFILDEAEARNEQLIELGVEQKDVMTDEGGEYVMVEEENGLKKTYLD